MRKSIFLMGVLFSFFVFTSTVLANQNTDAQDAALEQAKIDYRLFLQQLKALNSQYKEVSGEIKKVLKEEGMPVWDADSGELDFVKPGDTVGRANFADADIKENEKDILVKVDLPGMRKDKIKVRVENNKILHIEGERESEKEVSGQTSAGQYYRSERQYGRFERVIELPALAKDTGLEARYENGVLTIKIPKAAEVKKEVSVTVR
jgi:HSP20 family molecular chaperone IbpA